MNLYTRDSEVFQCGRGHFICGSCKPNLPVSKRRIDISGSSFISRSKSVHHVGENS